MNTNDKRSGVHKLLISITWVAAIFTCLWIMSTRAEAKFISVATTPIDCITEALYFEARDQSTVGQMAVANVILNRTRHSSHPDTVCGVVHAKAQFSYYSDGKPELVDDLMAWQRALNITSYVMFSQVFDVTEGATIYYNPDLASPNWDWSKLTKVVKIDEHVFYLEK